MNIVNSTRQNRKAVSARRRLEAGNANKYIDSGGIQPGDKVIIVARVSGRAQAHTRNLDDQVANLRQVVIERDAYEVASAYLYVGSGTDAAWMAIVAARARLLGAGLFAESTDRLVRSAAYHSARNPDAQARTTELEELRLFTDGVRLVTDLHPDATPAEVRSYQRKRGHRAKGKRGGRPSVNKPGYKKRRRDELQPRAVEMRQLGFSLRQIERELDVRHSTVQGWFQGCTVFEEGADS